MVNVVDLVICEVVVVDIDVGGNVNADVIVDFDDLRQLSRWAAKHIIYTRHTKGTNSVKNWCTCMCFSWTVNRPQFCC